MRINTNIAALNTQRSLIANTSRMQGSLEKLSSGLRINKAADDPAGLAISEKMRAQIRGLSRAADNAQDGISLIQTAESALGETTNILQRMRELAVQATNDIMSEADRDAIQVEMTQLRDEIERSNKTIAFNGKLLLTGDMTNRVKKETTINSDIVSTSINIDAIPKGEYKISVKRNAGDNGYVINVTDMKGNVIKNPDDGSEVEFIVGDDDFVDEKLDFEIGVDLSDAIENLEFGIKIGTSKADFESLDGAEIIHKDTKQANLHIGANASDEDVSLEINDMTAIKGLGLSNENIDVSTADNAKIALGKIEEALEKVNTQRGKLGAYQNRLEYSINSLGSTEENLTTAESRIRDVDMAAEIVEYTKNNILNQAAISMLAQANHLPESVLTLLQNK